ncbi:MAG: nucleotidyltransferase domain-containing protein [Bacteroidales bacterium]
MNILKIGPENIPDLVAEKLQIVYKLCEKYKVLRLYLFGSAANNNLNETSDLDFLVSFGDIPLIDYADYFFGLMHELEDLYGKKIDLVTEKSLTNPYLINSINRNKKILYDRGNQKISA